MAYYILYFFKFYIVQGRFIAVRPPPPPAANQFAAKPPRPKSRHSTTNTDRTCGLAPISSIIISDRRFYPLLIWPPTDSGVLLLLEPCACCGKKRRWGGEFFCGNFASSIPFIRASSLLAFPGTGIVCAALIRRGRPTGGTKKHV